MGKGLGVLPASLRAMAEQKMVLLSSKNRDRKLDGVTLYVSGYSDVMFLIADLVKVCVLALDSDGGCGRIPEPHSNISGVLGIVLDLLPYEEAEFLDGVRESLLEGGCVVDYEKELLIENVFLTMPAGLMD